MSDWRWTNIAGWTMVCGAMKEISVEQYPKAVWFETLNLCFFFKLTKNKNETKYSAIRLNCVVHQSSTSMSSRCLFMLELFN